MEIKTWTGQEWGLETHRGEEGRRRRRGKEEEEEEEETEGE